MSDPVREERDHLRQFVTGEMADVCVKMAQFLDDLEIREPHGSNAFARECRRGISQLLTQAYFLKAQQQENRTWKTPE